MAFSTKTDYCGLCAALNPATGNPVIAIRSASENASQQTYAPVGGNGNILGIEAFGYDASPSNEYALKGAIEATAGKIKLGTVVSVGSGSDVKKFRLESVKISTAANSPVTISASAQLVESGATNDDTKNYDLPAFDLDLDHVAQDIFTAFSLSGTGANLISCEADAKLSVSKDDLVGDIISNGVGEGLLTVSGKILCVGDTVPTITPTTNSGFVLTKSPTCSNPEKEYKSYEFELQKPLELHTSSST